MSFFDWFVAGKSARSTGNLSRGMDRRRPLRMERLEDRRVLAVTVDTLIDEADGSIVDGDISLRDAIALAAAGDEINFAPALTATGPATLHLTIPSAITIAKSLTITGPGASRLTIDASMIDPTPNNDNGDGRRIFITEDGVASRALVVIQGLTLTGADTNVFGGAITNRESLTLRNMVLRNNAALQGAGVASSGPLTIIDSEIFSNHSDQAGGGVHLNAGDIYTYEIVRTTIRQNTSGGRGGGVFSTVPFSSRMTITDSVIFDNESTSDGGGLSASGPHSIIGSAIIGNTSGANGGGVRSLNALTIESSLIDENSANAGGGVYAEGPLTVRDSTISTNDAAGNAGGIYVQNNTSLLSQVTVSGNTAKGSGGGIYTTQPITIRHSTIASNAADSDSANGGTGGGVFAGQPVGTPIVIDQSILAANRRGPETRDEAAGAIALRYSLISDNSGATITDNGDNLIGTGAAPIDPLLGTLQANDSRVVAGGYHLLTHAPSYTISTISPAIDAGDPAAASAMTTPTHDERGHGFARIWNTTALPTARIDMGAFEVQPIPLFADYNDDDIVNASDYTVWRNSVGSTTTLYADGDRNGVVNMQDYSYWKNRFGQIAFTPFAVGAELVSVPPEPISEALSEPLTANSFGSLALLPMDSPPRSLSRSGEVELRPTGRAAAEELTLFWADESADFVEGEAIASSDAAALDQESSQNGSEDASVAVALDTAFEILGEGM